MRKLTLRASGGKCDILIGERLENLPDYIGSQKTVVVTDSNVKHLFAKKFPKGEIIEVPAGEKAKTLETVAKLYERFLELELERGSLVVAVGGGAACDVAGFAAATYLRGIRSAFVPTTLLGQVDAAVGGKNGVNFQGYKNLVGTIRQPELVLCDLSLLESLPKSEIRNGFAEIVKCACIADRELFEFIEEHTSEALSLKRTAIEKCVHGALAVKLKAVEADENEAGERRKLNFGHTLGHAIEKLTGKAHGEAISAGMAAAARLSVEKGKLSQKDADRLSGLLSKIGLPVKMEFDRAAAFEAIRKDKKRQDESINFVLLEGIGKAVVEKVTLGELETVL